MAVEEKCSYARTLLKALQSLKFTMSIFTDKITFPIEKLYMVVRDVFWIMSNIFDGVHFWNILRALDIQLHHRC